MKSIEDLFSWQRMVLIKGCTKLLDGRDCVIVSQAEPAV